MATSSKTSKSDFEVYLSSSETSIDAQQTFHSSNNKGIMAAETSFQFQCPSCSAVLQATLQKELTSVQCGECYDVFDVQHPGCRELGGARHRPWRSAHAAWASAAGCKKAYNHILQDYTGPCGPWAHTLV